jgi:putative peptidoglycan binding protein
MMMRWTRLAIAVLIAGCAKGERDQKSQSAANTTTADTGMRTEATPVDTSSPAVRSDSGAAKKSAPVVAGKAKAAEADTTAARKQATTTAAANSNGVTGAEAMTGVRPTSPSGPLSGDQVKRLQAALNKVGCHVGTPDGVEGPGTQRAIACGLKKYKLASNDLNGLYRKLGLDF